MALPPAKLKRALIQLRPLEAGDCDWLLRLNNDRFVRANSFHAGKISRSRHRIWFKEKLADPRFLMLVAVDGGKKVGEVDFKIQGNRAVVALCVHRNYRGQSYGTQILSEGMKYLEKKSEIKTFEAQIKKSNGSSLRCFKKAGFNYQLEKKISGADCVCMRRHAGTDADAKREFFFRFDAGPGVGLGHMRRCLTLAEALYRDQSAQISIFTASPELVKRYLNFNARVIPLRNKKMKAEVAEFQTALLRRSLRPLIVDHYGYKKEEIEALKPYVARLIAFDDLGAAKRFCLDAVINHNVYGSRFAYGHSVKVFSGARYCLIPTDIKKIRRPAESQKSVVMTLGGGTARADLLRLAAIAEMIYSRGVNLKMFILSGVQKGRPLPELPHIRWISPEQFISAVSRAAVSFSASGVSAYEFAFLGIPLILVQNAENQKYLSKAMVESGAAIWGGDWSGLSNRRAADAIVDLLNNPARQIQMRNAGRRLIDGEGAKRLASELVRFIA